MRRMIFALAALAALAAVLVVPSDAQQGPVSAGSAMAQVSPSGSVAVITTPKTYPVDVTPVTDQVLQLCLAALAGIATWVGGAGGSRLLSLLHLQDSKIAHQVLDEGTKRAVGAASVALRQKFAGRHWSVDAHSELVKKAGDFLIAHYPAALKKVGIEFGKNGALTEASRDLINDKVEAVLGMLAIDAQKVAGAPHPVVAATTTPTAPGAPQGAGA